MENKALAQDSTKVYRFPTTYAQKALYFIQTMDAGSVAYNIPFAYRFSQAVDFSALQAAINAVVARHEIFRTVFREVEGELSQLVFPSVEITLEIEDAAQAEDPQAYVNDAVLDLARKPFDLAQGPLIRSKVFKISDTSCIWFLNFHHIAVDHLSILQFSQEVDSCYQQLLKTGRISEPVAPLHYGDYSVWQKQWQSADQLEAGLKYWQDAIINPDAVLSFPTDHNRPAVLSGQGEEFWFSFERASSDDIRALAKSANVSLYMVMLAAYVVLLHRYTGDKQITVGSPFANRGDQEELQNVMGCFINTLPLCFDLSDDPTFMDLLLQVKNVVMGAFSHQEMPFEMLVEALRPKRETSYNPVFQVSFMLQDPPMEVALGAAKAENLKLHNGSAKFDSMIWLWDEDSLIKGLFEFSTDVYQTDSMVRFIRYYENIVRQLASDPMLAVSGYSLFGEKEQAIVAESNATSGGYDIQRTLHNVIAEVVAKQQSAVAVVGDDGEKTYTELDSESNAIAHALIREGVSPGDYVGIALERSARMLAALLGILKAGAAYVPLDPDYPHDRLSYMVEHSGISVLVSESAVIESLGLDGLKTLDLDQAALTPDSSVPDVKVDPEQPAYVIYTSGSTGKPKGVMVPHRSVVNFLQTMQEKPGCKSSDTLLALTTLSFDIAVLELYLPLISGARVVIASRETAQDPALLASAIDKHGATMLQATPATWRMLLQDNWRPENAPRILVGGEALPPDLVDGLVGAASEVWNMYGPTETTVWSSCAQITDPTAPISIGKPIGNTQCYIVDDNDQELPPGIAGELLIGGSGVALGYLNRPDLTEERFVENSWGGQGLVYRTGDLVTRLDDGSLRFHNRLDNQVKVRGYRVELGEIEARLLDFPGLSAGAVVLQGEEEKRLVAFYVLDESVSASILKIRKYMAEYLPKYMLPEQFIQLDVMPLTPSGKIDRKALSLRTTETSVIDVQEAQLPKSETEVYYAGIWCELLNLSAVGLGDNFFDIGGYSLLSLRVVNRIREEKGVEISARALIMNNLGQLAAAYPLPAQATSAQSEPSPADAAPEVSPDSSAKQGKGLYAGLKRVFGR